MLQIMKEKSRKRRRLLVQQFGVSDESDLSAVLGNEAERETSRVSRESVEEVNNMSSKEEKEDKESVVSDLSADEMSNYTDSSTFLKGTQSANPHNDYCQHFLDTGHRPQNFVRDVGLADKFEDYPKLKLKPKLIKLEDELISHTDTPSMYLKSELKGFHFLDLRSKFDVISSLVTTDGTDGGVEESRSAQHELLDVGRNQSSVHRKDSRPRIRPGWLTIGPRMTNSNFNAETYNAYFELPNSNLTGCTERIESLRPKSPPPKSRNQQSGMSRGSSLQRGGMNRSQEQPSCGPFSVLWGPWRSSIVSFSNVKQKVN